MDLPAPLRPVRAIVTNSTTAAVQALAAVGGRDAEAGRAVRWLKDNQNAWWLWVLGLATAARCRTPTGRR